jgi:Leucine-rich repeat (LRR) protein
LKYTTIVALVLIKIAHTYQLIMGYTFSKVPINVFSQIPTEITHLILLQCDIKTIMLLSTVDKFFFKIHSEEIIWKNLMIQDYKDVEKLSNSFYESYKLCYELPELAKFLSNSTDICKSYDLKWMNVCTTFYPSMMMFEMTNHFDKFIRYNAYPKNLLINKLKLTTLYNLTQLDLHGCPKIIKKLKLLDNLKKLQSLNLSWMPFFQIPDVLCNLTDLKTLNLAGCNLTKLPWKFRQLVNLEILNLEKNHLIYVSELKQLIHLKEVNLCNNSINELPRLGCKLEKLNMANNPLIFAPKLTSCHLLKSLNLSNNQLTIPPKLKLCPLLSSLDLSFNPLIQLTSETLMIYFSEEQMKNVLSTELQYFYNL